MDKQKQLEKIAKLAEETKKARKDLGVQIGLRDAANRAYDKAAREYATSACLYSQACDELLEVAPHPTLVGPKLIPVADIPL